MREVLYLSTYPPLPAISGDAIRAWRLIQSLAWRGWRVHLFSLMPSGAVGADDQRRMEDICAEVTLIPFKVGVLRRLGRVVSDIVRDRCLLRDYFWSAQADAVLKSWLAVHTPDAVVVSQLSMARYLPDELWSMAVLDTHNAEYLRMQSMANNVGRHPRGFVAATQLGPTARFEQAVVQRAAATVAVSEEELRYFDRIAPGKVVLIPNGIDIRTHAPRAVLPTDPSLVFIGAMRSSANVDAARYLIEDILPKIRNPNVRLSIVGGWPPKSLQRLAQTSAVPTTVHGLVPSPRPFLERSRICVVPLRYGGGTRLKILEAFASGVPVVSTSLGCAGLAVTNGRELLIADTAADFAQCLERLINDDALCRTLSNNARALVEHSYDWALFVDTFEHLVSQVAAQQGTR